MPTPASRAIASRLTSLAPVAKAADAASIRRSRLRAASERGRREAAGPDTPDTTAWAVEASTTCEFSESGELITGGTSVNAIVGRNGGSSALSSMANVWQKEHRM